MSKVDSAPPPKANPPVRRPTPGGTPNGPWDFVVSSARMGWRWLTRMKTALYILGILGILTLVATVVPQEPNVPTTVAQWRTGEAGPGVVGSQLIDLFGLYDTYGSPAFLALLVLLFLSLTACLIPRIKAFVRLARRGRPPQSRNLDTQPEHAQWVVDGTPDEVAADLRARLDGGRWRLRAADATRASTDGGVQVAAEKGIISREGGSLLFHLSFYVLLVGVVIGQLVQFSGQVGVIEGHAFNDTRAAYWTATPGRWFGFDDHAGFRLELDDFRVDWVRTVEQGATPKLFEADVTVTERDGTVRSDTIQGNVPMVIDGFKVHLLDWGLAPAFEVRIDDELVWEGTQTAVITNSIFHRTAIKAPNAYDNGDGLGATVEVYPNAPMDADGDLRLTGAPWPDAPLAALSLYRGDLQLDVAQNVNTLDTTGLDEVGLVPLRPGDSATLPGNVEVTFTGLQMWAGLQVSHRPTVPVLLTGALLLLAGLVPALYAYRRRLWVEAVADEHGATLVTVAGRAFQRPEAFTDEFAELVATWRRDLPSGTTPVVADAAGVTDASVVQGTQDTPSTQDTASTGMGVDT